MLSREFMAIARPRIRMQRIIWIAFVTAPVVYLAIGILAVQDRGETGPRVPAILPAILAATAIGQATAAFLLHRHLRSEAQLRRVLAGERTLLGAAAPRPAPPAPDPERVAALPESERRLPDVLAHLQTTMIVCCALLEATAIFGLVLVLLGWPTVTMVPFVAAALIGCTLLVPRPEPVLEEAARLARRM
jgi:hypothetical protein